MEYDNLKDPIYLPEDPALIFERIDGFLAEQRENAATIVPGSIEASVSTEYVEANLISEPIKEKPGILEPPKRPTRLTRKIEKIAGYGFFGGLGVAAMGLFGLGITTFIQNSTMEDLSYFVGRLGLIEAALSAGVIAACNTIEMKQLGRHK